MVDALFEIQRAALTTGEDPRRTGSLLRKLANFSLTHFALEEGMMVATKSPDWRGTASITCAWWGG